MLEPEVREHQPRRDDIYELGKSEDKVEPMRIVWNHHSFSL
jgi:hypothetical protein